MTDGFLEVRGKRYPVSTCFIDRQATDGRRRWIVITNGEEEMGTEHEKNDDNDNDGSSGTTDGHDHFEEEEDSE